MPCLGPHGFDAHKYLAAYVTLHGLAGSSSNYPRVLFSYRVFIMFGLLLIVVTAIALSVQQTDLANIVALIAYVSLVFGTALAILESLAKRGGTVATDH